eukprot:jgi/Tetstr1/434071/TSEL_023215.t1
MWAADGQVEAELPAVETPGLMPGWGMCAGQQGEPRWMKDDRAKAEQVDDVMGVGEDPVGEDGMDIDAPAWPPAGVEPAMRA